ncbi:MAG: nucleotidyltransferase family protein [Deltaproteobacteria bacterium]|nr:nucleotidyltransferase family protein [Deltaproteobacteria bacterium]MBW2418664.1 nucleotidyltransferase family protein [Deltaproteobacteria bacterium]
MGVPAIVTAGDRGAARAVYGESKVFLEVEGRALVSRVVAVLQAVPEVSEVWVVGNAERLEEIFGRNGLRAELTKPLHIIEQHRNLYENCWEAFIRALPGAGPEGREPGEADLDAQVLFLSGDLPFATPQEISAFIRDGQALDCDYALGLVAEPALEPFTTGKPGQPVLDVAYFNLREARLRQNNLHIAKPLRMGHRHYIEEMYEHRHMRKFGNMFAIALRLVFQKGGFVVALFYFLMHLGGLADRKGYRGLADWMRRAVTLAHTERVLSRILDTRFRFLVTEVGGCAIDVDTEADYDAVRARFEEWSQQQDRRAAELVGPLPLPAEAARTPEQGSVAGGESAAATKKKEAASQQGAPASREKEA